MVVYLFSTCTCVYFIRTNQPNIIYFSRMAALRQFYYIKLKLNKYLCFVIPPTQKNIVVCTQR